jgi:hypothetical protein
MTRLPASLRLIGPLLIALWSITPSVGGAELLVADRLNNSVYRFSESGELLNTVLADGENLNQPSGMALSPDRSRLYVSSFQNSRVMRYDYDPMTGTATNPAIFAEGFADGIAAPGGIALGDKGQTIYVANLGGTGVARFNADGSSAGAPLQLPSSGGNSFAQFSGLAWGPSGELLVAAFQDFPAGTSGAIASWQVGAPQMELAVGPSNSLNGVSGLFADGDQLYASGLFASNVQRFDLTTGLADPSFLIEGIPFPQSIVAAPDGNGLLVGVLGFEDGEGDIVRYDLDGELVEFWASPGMGGFEEPTVMVVVPDVLPADFNGDGRVDALDYTVWRNTLGSTTDLRADANGDLKIDADDYLAWKEGFGGSSTAALATPLHAVPEPAGVGLLLFTLIAAARGFASRSR